MINSEFEDTDRPLSVQKIWVQLELAPRAIKLRASLDEVEDLNDFAPILTREIRDLIYVDPYKLEFLDKDNNIHPPNTDIKSLAETATYINPLVVRYPISGLIINVTFMYGQKQAKRVIPHTSGSFDRLKVLAREIFKDLEEGIIYFVNDGTEIWNAYNFNTIVTPQTAQDELKLKVMIKGRKKYSHWKLRDVFKDILGKPNYDSLSDMQRLVMTEFPPLDPPFNESELTDFVKELKNRLISFQEEFGNGKNRVYINAFMAHAVCYIRTNINESVILDVEKKLSGSHGYGPIDYWVKFIEVLLLLCEAKDEDMNQGVAQVIVQMQSVIEQLSGQGHEKLIYGIASTGKLWRFIRWSGSSENPEVHISKEYTCSFKDGMECEKEILTCIAQIIKTQVYLYDKNSEHLSKRVKVNEK